MKKLFCALGFVACSVVSVLGFGELGHQTIANVAESRLPAATKAHIHSILGNESMADAAVWPDKIRFGGSLHNSTDGRSFNRAHPDNSGWHFVNLPLGTKEYKFQAAGTKTNDIVHAIGLCVDVLEGTSTNMNKKDALRWLIHLVGDIHQPLHVACGYYQFTPTDKALLIKSPLKIDGRDHDRGANRLKFGSQNLHSHWDTALVKHLDSRDPEKTLEQTIAERAKKLKFTTKGDYRFWALSWATKSLKASNKAYKEITIGSKHPVPGSNNDWFIDVQLPGGTEGYNKAHVDEERDQLARAAIHLAELLKAIHWN